MLRIPAPKIVRRLVWATLRTLRPGAVIFGYHRVANEGWDPLSLCVGPREFADQMACLRRATELVTVAELLERADRGTSLSKVAAVTFDDGFGDFFDFALPLLERFEVPATLFVTSGYAGQNFWWDPVVAAFNPEPQAAEELQIRLGSEEYQGVADVDMATKLVGRLCAHLEQVDAADRDSVVEMCRVHCARYALRNTSPAGLSVDQLATLAEHPLIELGAHGDTHARFDVLDEPRQRQELLDSKAALDEAVGNSRAVGMSYPHGAMSQQTPALVERAGYAYACASYSGVVRRKFDRFRLPRVWPPNQEGRAFRSWLRQSVGFGVS